MYVCNLTISMGLSDDCVAKLQSAVKEVKAAAASREKSNNNCKMCLRFDAELRHLQDENHALTQALQAAERAAEKTINSAHDVLLLQV